MAFALLSIATLLLAALTLLPMWRHEGWWVRALDFPRAQFAILGIVVLLLDTVWLEMGEAAFRVLSTIALLCTAYQATWIIPYTRLYPVEVKSARAADRDNCIRIMTTNVLTPNRNARGLLRLVRSNQPDVLVTLESDAWWQVQLDSLQNDYPHSLKQPQDNLYGMHLYSKFPLSDSQIKYLVEAGIPSIHTLVRLPSGQKIRLHCLHPTPPAPPENDASTERDAELVAVARSVAYSKHMPTIVTGDLNDVAWSETTRLFRKISGMLDPRVGRGMFNTFHAGYWFMRWPLDHLFHTDHFTLESMRRLPGFGSDHFPLLTELHYEPRRKQEHDGLETEDPDWADEKVEGEDVSKEDVPTPGRS